MHGERHLLLLQLQGHWRCELHASPAWWSWWCWRSSLQSAGCRAPSSRHRRCIELFLQRIRVVWFQRFNVFQHVEKNKIQPTRKNPPPPHAGKRVANLGQWRRLSWPWQHMFFSRHMAKVKWGKVRKTSQITGDLSQKARCGQHQGKSESKVNVWKGRKNK